MDLFISWSGQLSKNLAVAFKEWIENVIQTVKPWMSSEDIEKGDRWSEEIAGKLDQSEIGVICLTQDNWEAPWINFEAGALSKKLEESKVCTLLFDIKATDLKGPLAQFQATVATNKEEVKKLVFAINRAQQADQIEDSRLERAFEIWWPSFAKDVRRILTGTPHTVPRDIRSEKELLREVFSILQRIEIEEDLRQRKPNMGKTGDRKAATGRTHGIYQLKSVDFAAELNGRIRPNKHLKSVTMPRCFIQKNSDGGYVEVRTLNDGTQIAQPVLVALESNPNRENDL